MVPSACTTSTSLLALCEVRGKIRQACDVLLLHGVAGAPCRKEPVLRSFVCVRLNRRTAFASLPLQLPTCGAGTVDEDVLMA
jgi:hypothetical protein